jgi:hypothetical protein
MDLSRMTLIQVRRSLIDQVQETISSCELFTKDSIFPRRYFDDLMLV